MSKTDELRQLNQEMEQDSIEAIDKMKDTAYEARRASRIFYQTGDILSELDKEFSKATRLHAADFGFLFLATGLQCARIFLINKLTAIEKAGRGDQEKILKKGQSKILGKLDNGLQLQPDSYYAPLNQIITTLGVPYDVTAGGKEYGLFSGGNHRFATLGHDPVLGLVFGTSNILTNTITCANAPIITTNHVKYEADLLKGTLHIRNPRISTPASTLIMLDKAAQRVKDDKRSVFAALIKQIIHIWTDLYTPAGIQLPGINLVLSHKNVDRLTKYVSTGDVIKVGASAGIAVLINTLIEALHTLMYQEEKHGDFMLYSVKTRKIIMISNVIATSSNIIWTGSKTAATRNLMHLKELDIGGLIVTVKRLITDLKFINDIKREFLLQNFEKLISDRNDEEEEYGNQ